jgi:prefoldin subunit 5
MAGRVTQDQMHELERRLDQLQEEVDENRRLNERLSDLIDVVAEVLVPAADRDDERLRAALEKLNQKLA